MIRLSRCFKRIFGHLLVPRQSCLKHYSIPNQTFSVAFFQTAAWGDVLYSVHFYRRKRHEPPCPFCLIVAHRLSSHFARNLHRAKPATRHLPRQPRQPHAADCPPRRRKTPNGLAQLAGKPSQPMAKRQHSRFRQHALVRAMAGKRRGAAHLQAARQSPRARVGLVWQRRVARCGGNWRGG